MKTAGLEDLDINAELAVPIIAFGILIIVIGLLGCATCKFKNPCFAVPFGALTFIFGVLLLIFAAFALGGDAVTAAVFNDSTGICKPEAGKKLSKFDQLYKENVDNLMCTDTCPCYDKDDDGNKRYPFTLNDDHLRTRYGRTLHPKPNENANYNA